MWKLVSTGACGMCGLRGMTLKPHHIKHPLPRKGWTHIPHIPHIPHISQDRKAAANRASAS